MCAQSIARMRNQKSTHRHSPYKLLNTKNRHLSKQRILYIQFSVLVKSNARMFNCGDNTHRDRLFRTILALNLLSLPKVNFCHPQKFRRLPEGLPHRTLSSPQPLQKDNNPSPHVCPFIQYVNHSPVCSPAHSSAFGTASPQGRCKAPK